MDFTNVPKLGQNVRPAQEENTPVTVVFNHHFANI